MAIHYLQPMSAKQVTEAFDEVELASAARHLRELERWGLLEIAGELRGGKRRGGTERMYRPVRAAHFDTPTWKTLPHFLRIEWSASILEGLLLRITHSLQAGVFDAEKDRSLFWKDLEFDRAAWHEYVTRLDATLAWVSELEAESKARIAETREESILMTIALLAFRSPPHSTSIAPVSCTRPSEARNPYFLMSPPTAKALANPWRTLILAELHVHPLSPKQFFGEFGGPDLATIARYFRQLRLWGYLEIAWELRGGMRRGSIEKVHRAVRRTHFSPAMWEALPAELRRRPSGVRLNGLILRINEAVRADTFDAETSRHTSWKVASLDRQAWTECATELEELRGWVKDLGSHSARHIDKGGEQIPATIALMAFRSPEPLSMYN